MKEIVAQTLDIYFKKLREPKIEELTSVESSLTSEKGCCFVTLYLNGEVHGSAGNIKEISKSLAEELIANTMQALTGDKRFTPLTLEQSEKLQFRVDHIVDRKMITLKDLKKLDPLTSGVIVIKRDYEKLAVVLPNMSPKIMTGDDFVGVLLKKLKEKKFKESDYIIYSIITKAETNF
ncbi:AMMECR1 domain-containing protein [Candidatus Gracilibacteria bacterium]|nr:AMMECR1 domain-containing protein [Candidatus Gracilibacteria bacterium]